MLTRYVSHRKVLPSLPQGLSFYIARAFSPDVDNTARPCSLKFSARMIVKHTTHMFQDLQALHMFLAHLKIHPGWQECVSIIDGNVYNKYQHIRVACASKVPQFDPMSTTLDHSTNNILLPVNATTGELDMRGLKLTKSMIYLRLNMWSKFLVTATDFGLIPEGYISGVLYRIPLKSGKLNQSLDEGCTLT